MTDKQEISQQTNYQKMEQFEIQEPNQPIKSIESDSEQIIDGKVTYKALYKAMLPYAFLSYGGPLAHIAMLEQKFIDELHWITEEQFTELFALCQSLPGPTSTQLIIAVGSLVTQSAWGGILSFLIFSVPAATILFIFGLTFRYLNQIDFIMPDHIQYALDGFQSAAIALVAQAAWKLGNNYKKQPIHLATMFASAVIFFLFQSPYTMIAIMAAGGFISLFLVQVQIKNDVITNQDQSVVQDGYGPFGKISLYLFFIILITLTVLSFTFPSFNIIQYMTSFYSMGSIIVGGGHVILPLIKTEFEQFGLDDKEFWDGFSIVSALPGPLFNISIYVGAIIDGVVGGLVGWVSLFLPAFLMIYGILPFWNKYRTNPKIQNILKGVGAASIGFVITSVYLLWEAASEQDSVTSTLIAIGSFVALHIYGCRAPFVVLSGGVLMVCRQVVLVKYRGLPEN